MSVNWIMQEAAGLAGVTPQSGMGGSKHLCCNGLRFSFHNGGMNAKWDPDTYDFDRGARGAMADSNGQLSMLADLAGDAAMVDMARVRELDVVLVGNQMAGCEVVYLGAPVDSDIGRRWGWITMLWTIGDEGLAGWGETEGGAPPRGPVDPSGGYDGFRAMPVDDVPPLTVKPTVRPAEGSGAS
ncbi:hypothetical protein DVS28_a1087 [Euzebya pacifica]|uniref:Uncharacterized protein n=1 Tax=Euzebya pacifica TaxID=1608957 RepID=A0A346XU91_9ACTN|nr:hypothetical protein DVS28_a1087 [Euzebya pacifica]